VRTRWDEENAFRKEGAPRLSAVKEEMRIYETYELREAGELSKGSFLRKALPSMWKMMHSLCFVRE